MPGFFHFHTPYRVCGKWKFHFPSAWNSPWKKCGNFGFHLLTCRWICGVIAFVKFELPKEMVEKMRLIAQPHQIPSTAGELVKTVKEIGKSQNLLPEQIGNLSEQIGKLVTIAEVQVEIAKFQAKIAEESAKEAKNLSEQTDRLVSETIELRRFTKGVFWLTVVLSIFTLVLIVIAFLEYSTKANEGVKGSINQQSTQNHQAGQQ